MHMFTWDKESQNVLVVISSCWEKDSAFQNGLFAVVEIWLIKIIPLSYWGCFKKVALVQWIWFPSYLERTFNYKLMNQAVSPCADWF